MATFRRSTTPGATYFFTVNTHQRQKVLTQPLFYTALKRSIRAVKQLHPFDIDAFVLLPDHLHCIWTLPINDADYALRWNMTKRSVIQQIRHLIASIVNASRYRRGELGLWQRRYWEHQIRDENDFEKHADYIHWNPVKHGHVTRPEDWAYSSIHRFIERGIYPKDWTLGVSAGRESDDGGFGEMA
jgi:putative transposase